MAYPFHSIPRKTGHASLLVPGRWVSLSLSCRAEIQRTTTFYGSFNTFIWTHIGSEFLPHIIHIVILHLVGSGSLCSDEISWPRNCQSAALVLVVLYTGMYCCDCCLLYYSFTRNILFRRRRPLLMAVPRNPQILCPPKNHVRDIMVLVRDVFVTPFWPQRS